MNTDLTFIADELAAISNELDSASGKLARYETAIDLTRVRTPEDLLLVLDALNSHVMTMDLHDPECVSQDIENAMANVRFNIEEMGERAAIAEADDLPPVMFSVGQIADIRN